MSEILEFIEEFRNTDINGKYPIEPGEMRETRLEMKLLSMQYKGNICQKCKIKFHHVAMEFHHKNPKEKDFEISKMFTKKWKEITKELDKCILVCRNCHAVIHYELNQIKFRNQNEINRLYNSIDF